MTVITGKGPLCCTLPFWAGGHTWVGLFFGCANSSGYRTCPKFQIIFGSLHLSACAEGDTLPHQVGCSVWDNLGLRAEVKTIPASDPCQLRRHEMVGQKLRPPGAQGLSL